MPRFTAAQVGVANDPSLHTTATAPALAGQLDLAGDEYGTVAAPAGFGGPRAFRAVSAGQPAPQTVALGDNMGVRLVEHERAGIPDARRNDQQLSGHPSGESAQFAPAPQDWHNERRVETVEPTSAPDRARQGFTGADPTRAAMMQRPYMIRPFDKGMAEHPGDMVKLEFTSPLASRPREFGRLTGGLPTAGGSTGTDRAGIGPQPNTARVMPLAWDRLLINTGGPAVTAAHPDPAQAAAAARGRTFR